MRIQSSGMYVVMWILLGVVVMWGVAAGVVGWISQLVAMT